MPVNNMLRDLSMRRPWLYRQPIGVTRGGIATFACACAAIFVCFYAVGRATVPANPPQLQASTGLELTYTGATVPASLGTVPPIATIAFSPESVSVAKHPVTHAPASAAPVPATPSSQATSAPAIEAPSTVTPAATPSPAPSAPASSPRHHHSGGSVPFDSSG